MDCAREMSGENYVCKCLKNWKVGKKTDKFCVKVLYFDAIKMK